MQDKYVNDSFDRVETNNDNKRTFQLHFPVPVRVVDEKGNVCSPLGRRVEISIDATENPEMFTPEIVKRITDLLGAYAADSMLDEIAHDLLKRVILAGVK